MGTQAQPTDDERLSALEAIAREHARRLDDGGATIKRIEAGLAENTASTRKVEAATADIVDFFGSMKGAFKVLNWIGNLAKPIGALVALAVAMWSAWQAFRNGAPPAPPHQ